MSSVSEESSECEEESGDEEEEGDEEVGDLSEESVKEVTGNSGRLKDNNFHEESVNMTEAQPEEVISANHNEEKRSEVEEKEHVKDMELKTPYGCSTEAEGRKTRKRKQRYVTISLTNCKYESVRRAARICGLKEVGEDEEWILFWTDYSVSLERVMEMKRFQKINHFPGMSEICRKDLLARNMNRLLKLFPKEYNIFPKTWCLPADYGEFQAFCRVKKNWTYICKPDSGCQGRGIFITRNPKYVKPGEHMICQQYISKPFVLDGFKFDLRIYVLITSCDPLRIFIYEEGLARFATSKYTEPSSSNVDDICMHLTNYAINKRSENFIRDEEIGSKWKLSTLKIWMEKHGFDTVKLWEDIEDVVIKTLISAYPVLKHNYRTCFPIHVVGNACFEILGFDILLDKKLKPWLLEVNHSPSFTTDSQLDREVKDALLCDTLNLINLRACDKKKILGEDKRRVTERLLQKIQHQESRREQYENSQAAWLEEVEKYERDNSRGYHRIYPRTNKEKYDKFFKHSGSLFQETAASKAREECARQQLAEIRLKKEQGPLFIDKKRKEPKESLQGESAEERVSLRRAKKKAVPNIPFFKHTPRDKDLRRRELKFDLPARSSRLDSPDIMVKESNSMAPVDITEEEEMERINGMLQRENLVRGLGIAEKVYKMLQQSGNRGFQQAHFNLPGNTFPQNAGFIPDLRYGPTSQEREDLVCNFPTSMQGGSNVAGLELQNVLSINKAPQFGTYSSVLLPRRVQINQNLESKVCQQHLPHKLPFQKNMLWTGGKTEELCNRKYDASIGLNTIYPNSSSAKLKSETIIGSCIQKRPVHTTTDLSGSVNSLPCTALTHYRFASSFRTVTNSHSAPSVEQLSIISAQAPLTRRADFANHAYVLGILNPSNSRRPN
ncbi:tubulin polyglutamylase TTLL13-like [Protopterus annectens]|uniref:tubulin polyglutamylase TTLL13-like n=1 Tax=Protopterus annectens TaxID=7888 RepID=UPI001CF9F521|nr:tubulin polyglutamylase TTLL13-like [Protopterus annectens]